MEPFRLFSSAQFLKPFPFPAASLVHDHKDVLAVDNMPIASLALPVAIFVGVPIAIAPIVIGMHCGAICGAYRGPIAPVHDGLSVRVLR